MHPQNPYRTPLDFIALAEAYPNLKPFLKKGSTGVVINFQDEAAQRCLTKALLLCDFGLSLDLPPDRLCPPVPNRLNYILWIQDIMGACARREPTHGVVRCVDIGTGASAIYPLLGCKSDPSWIFWVHRD
ncbi:uncharacterized protein PHACADRAFT_258519 [Phanerochaete carnosa HHB-10118-sp]|uniref:Uncharacterized protein n=1 Tax=Phanerochaete carnosa (strain HHB-10118-sp) TaxID=650164 RepID=K5UWX3_PHACS|nr:uncharacterized protein PHACADRAFT_258519 [Phanerochaete carnosa HHB-10118-sp]EKM54576.1 hypothetical protein PHACADRAFT_258519 [Phanerochaete carnosa HHB-10118-sp]